MAVEFGLQLYSVREELQKDFVGTLEKVASIGYKNVELFFHDANLEANVGNMSASELKGELDRLGLKAVSAHVALDFLEEKHAQAVVNFAKEVGITSLGIAIAFFTSKEEVLTLAKKMNEAGTFFKENGLQLYYHNHFQEFQEIDGKYILDIILENTDEEIVKVELDTYWALRGGVDPIEYMKKLGSRCDLLHQKDLPASVETVNLFDVVGHDATIDMDKMVELHQIDDFTEAGQGVMDIPAIVQAFKEKPEAKYLFIEQDWTRRNQLESVEMSYQYISKYF
ncbi:sugar phosphate isomerase/epimerase [Bacillaceae bacterium SIJ1]|uniref:sugar phosphate isomerase/epimerase family protein n=1 Tax=Litoribacterium kuwaitense TaxID=1398745 RepID=UPI0013ECD80E|nr:sugar phosphate isomerase/epimerase [Litoribacterium kuwaitense]NGP46891.1 sugar phosphate isomerase/epimerase [Litoribacterium kuwaitense]